MSGTAPDQLIGRPARAAEYQAFAATPQLIVVAPPQFIQPQFPDRLFGQPARAAYQQAFAGPLSAVTAPTPQVIQPIVPPWLWGRPARAAEYQAHGWPGRFLTPVVPPIPGFGPQGVATLELSLEPGTRITYSWQTAVFKSYDGNEQRISPSAIPKIKIDGVAFMLDTQSRDVRSTLMKFAAHGSVFLISAPFEEVRIASDSTDTTINLTTTANVDWLQIGQRALVVGGDDTTVNVVIQSVSTTTVTIATFSASGSATFGTIGSAGLAGGRFMPLLQVILDPQQGFARYPVAADLWSIRATASTYGWAGTDAMGIGTTATTYFGGRNVAIENVSENDLIIWDRGNAVDGTVNESMLGLTEVVDLGGIPFTAGGAASPDWTRTIKFVSSAPDDWQWCKAFIRHCRGNQVAFGLPTGRNDLIYLGPAPPTVTPGGLKVANGSVSGGNDYLTWFNTQMYSRLALTLSSGAVQYVTVRSVSDDSVGALTLTIDQSLDGPVVKVSFLEQVRLETGDVETTWDGGQFSVNLTARVAREVITLQPGVIFDKVIEIVNPNGPPLPPEDQAFGGALGQNTMINWNGHRNCNLCAITNVTGVYTDGMVVCICWVGSNTNVFVASPENPAFAAHTRLKGFVHADIGQALWYRYNATIQRWVQFALI